MRMLYLKRSDVIHQSPYQIKCSCHFCQLVLHLLDYLWKKMENKKSMMYPKRSLCSITSSITYLEFKKLFPVLTSMWSKGLGVCRGYLRVPLKQNSSRIEIYTLQKILGKETIFPENKIQHCQHGLLICQRWGPHLGNIHIKTCVANFLWLNVLGGDVSLQILLRPSLLPYCPHAHVWFWNCSPFI